MLGTTPPQGACSSACVARASPRTLPSLETTATPVSSQLDSMPSTSKGLWLSAATAAAGVLAAVLLLAWLHARTCRAILEVTLQQTRWALLLMRMAAWAMLSGVADAAAALCSRGTQGFAACSVAKTLCEDR